MSRTSMLFPSMTVPLSALAATASSGVENWTNANPLHASWRSLSGMTSICSTRPKGLNISSICSAVIVGGRWPTYSFAPSSSDPPRKLPPPWKPRPERAPTTPEPPGAPPRAIDLSTPSSERKSLYALSSCPPAPGPCISSTSLAYCAAALALTSSLSRYIVEFSSSSLARRSRKLAPASTRSVPLISASSFSCRFLCSLLSSSTGTKSSRTIFAAASTSRWVSPVIITCIGSSSTGSYGLLGSPPGLEDPRPRMAMLVFVSRCIFFCVLPRGPMIRPKKLYPGWSATGMNILRVLRAGLKSGGGVNPGQISIKFSMSSPRRVAYFSLSMMSRVLVRTPLAS